jgi:hypothetical protein
MAEILNLRIARKRAAREQAARQAAENRLAHGTPRQERTRATAERERSDQTLDQHRIETGDRR